MMIMARFAAAACSCVMLAQAATVAAAPARTTWTAYLYQGPGTHYMVVDEIPQSAAVDVEACKDGWCRVVSDRRIGYLQAEVVARLDAGQPAAGVLPQPATTVSPRRPPGPCVKANQTSGNGGNAMTIFCDK